MTLNRFNIILCLTNIYETPRWNVGNIIDLPFFYICIFGALVFFFGCLDEEMGKENFHFRNNSPFCNVGEYIMKYFMNQLDW